MKLPRIPYWYLLLGPTMCWYVGFFLNWLVCYVNGGQMPVLMIGGGCTPEQLGLDANGMPLWQCLTDQTHLKLLADVVYRRADGFAYSLGDFFEMFRDETYGPALVAWAALMIEKVKNG